MKSGMTLARWLAHGRYLLDCQRFRSMRGAYCDYLGALLSATRGGRTLRDIFAQDAYRYGPSTVRGRLSARWLQAYQTSGGDLYASWGNSFPEDELVVIRSAQAAGNTALVQVLAALSQACALTGRMRAAFAGALWSAGLATLLLWCMLLAVPWWTVPRLRQAFDVLPPEYYSGLVTALLELARYVQHNWLTVLVLGAGGWSSLLWSLPNFTGRVRNWLDRYSCWRLYRQVHGLRLLTLLVIMLGNGDVAATRLRSALTSLSSGASPWLASHLTAMLAHVDAGQAGAQSFETGLLDREQFWFLADMIAARGLHAGLALGCDRLRQQALKDAERQAQALRWSLLLGVLGCMLGLGLWHYAVIDDLRRALMLFYASQ